MEISHIIRNGFIFTEIVSYNFQVQLENCTIMYYFYPMFIKREIQKELTGLMQEYPVVTLTGPRQSGKTTLARSTFPGFNYCNLEKPEIRTLAENDANALLETFYPPVIIDEIQRVPQLLSHKIGRASCRERVYTKV